MKIKINNLASLVFSVLLVSCQNSIVFEKDPTVMINDNPSAPLTAIVEMETQTRLDSVVVKLASSDHSFKVSKPYQSKMHIIGFNPNNRYDVEIQFYSNGNLLASIDTISITTPPLPNNPALMPRIEVTKIDPKRTEPGYILFNPRRNAPKASFTDDKFNQAYGMLMAIDATGNVIWYYTCDSRISDFDILDNGNITYLTHDNSLVEIDWAGNIINSWYASNRPEDSATDAIPIDAQTMHHDVMLLPNGNRVALGTEWKLLPNYYSDENNGKRSTQKVMGDIVYEFSPDGKVVWEWNAFDYLNPYVAGYQTFIGYWASRGFPDVLADWSHANAVTYDEKSDAFLVNFRHLSLILKIDKKSKDIVWAFGHHTDVLKDKSKFITLTDGEFPWHQHSPEITPNNTLLFFNNDNYKANLPDKPERVQNSYSYANEYSIDEKTMTGSEIWNSRIASDSYIVSVAMGDVDYLPQTGNVLVAYGLLLNRNHLPNMTSWKDRKGRPWTMMREYTHTTPAEIVWEVQLKSLNSTTNIGWDIFGVEKFEF